MLCRGVRKLTELYPSFSHCLGHEDVMKHFLGTVSKAKKSTKPELKAAAVELEGKLSSNGTEVDGIPNSTTAPTATPKRAGRAKREKTKPQTQTAPQRRSARSKTAERETTESSEEDSDE